MNLADQKTKESVLAEQRNWVAMKEEATLLSIGSSEENGQHLSSLQNSFPGRNYEKQSLCSCQ